MHAMEVCRCRHLYLSGMADSCRVIISKALTQASRCRASSTFWMLLHDFATLRTPPDTYMHGGVSARGDQPLTPSFACMAHSSKDDDWPPAPAVSGSGGTTLPTVKNNSTYHIISLGRSGQGWAGLDRAGQVPSLMWYCF